jgi:hypothetical protein
VTGARAAAVAIGVTAHAALGRTGGRARVLARLTASTYLVAGDTIVWLGAAGAPLHPRAILGAGSPVVEADAVWLEVARLAPWSPPALALDARVARALGDGWRRLAAGAAALGEPPGFGALLAGAPLVFPLAGAGDAAAALARACARDDAAAAVDAAGDLLGLGDGLTPSGDDFVGAALFARALLVRAGLADAAGWRAAAAAVREAATARTHPISAALLGDLADGRSWAPLHDLVGALAAGDAAAAGAAARQLVALGHASGWDLLAGLGAGLGALAA